VSCLCCGRWSPCQARRLQPSSAALLADGVVPLSLRLCAGGFVRWFFQVNSIPLARRCAMPCVVLQRAGHAGSASGTPKVGIVAKSLGYHAAQLAPLRLISEPVAYRYMSDGQVIVLPYADNVGHCLGLRLRIFLEGEAETCRLGVECAERVCTASRCWPSVTAANGAGMSQCVS
jgi:hypothetical protein